MSSAVDIQIVSSPNLDKIENFFKDVSYRETIEFSANFNTRLCVERRLRLPFFDPQTRVAQNHSHLFMDKRQRMPGFRQGQIYTYPATRWRKSRRQYLNKMYRFPDRPFQALRKEHEAYTVAGTASPLVAASLASTLDADLNGTLLDESLSMGAAGGDTSDSKDSQHLAAQQQQHQQQQQQAIKEDMSKEWFYDDMEMNELDGIEEPKSPADDEFDYDPRYGSKKRRKRRPSKRAASDGVGCGGGGSGVGRRRTGGHRGRASAAATAAAANTPDASSLSTLDSTDGNSSSLTGDVTATPTSTTTSGRRPRGTGGTRGRRRTKAHNSNACGPPSPGLNSEPPSFETAAAFAGVMGDLSGVGEEQGDLRNYRKFL